MDDQRRSMRIDVARVVAVSYAHAEESLHLRSSELMEIAFPSSNGDKLFESKAMLHLRHFSMLRLPAQIEFGRPHDGSKINVLHLSWKGRYLTRMFPVLEADIQLQATGAHETAVTLVGTYIPPLGLIGALGDQLIGVAAARSTAEQFLEDLGLALEKDAKRLVR